MKKIKILKDIGIVTVYDGKEIKVYKVDEWLDDLEADCWWHRVKRKLNLFNAWD